MNTKKDVVPAAKKIRKRFRTTIPNKIRALLVAHPDIKAAEIKHKLPSAKMPQIYQTMCSWKKKHVNGIKDKRPLNTAVEKIMESQQNGIFDAKKYLQFRELERQIEEIGISQVELIIASMKK